MLKISIFLLKLGIRIRNIFYFRNCFSYFKHILTQIRDQNQKYFAYFRNNFSHFKHILTQIRN